MRIDAHQHFWQYDSVEYSWISEEMPQIKRSFLPGDLSPLLQAEGFSACVAVQARQSRAENDFLLQLARDHDFVAAVVGWVDLRDPQLDKQLSALKSHAKLTGFRHIVQDEPDDEFLLQEDFIRGVKALKSFGYTYDILIYEKHLPVVTRFLEHFDDQPFVLDHLGKPVVDGPPSSAWVDGIRAIAAYPQLMCKVSGLVTEADWENWTPELFYPYLEVVLEAFGPERLMVGSDWPVCLLAADDYHSVMDIPTRFFGQLSATEQAAIFGGNAARFYGIELTA